MLGKLVEIGAAPEQRREIAITKDEFLIGRGDDCDLRLRIAAVSRHHCLIRIRAGETQIQDLGSANGTFVNGQRVRSQIDLQNGDDIAIGQLHFKLELLTGSGIDWAPIAGAPGDLPTVRGQLQAAPESPDEATKEESHPPGEAGG